ncbi:MAG: response regulator transcription factor [Clostridia bacterium]|nr:response regulator transcription factor [Clostridia bacterium]
MSNKYKILIIEDDISIKRVLKALLEANKYQVILSGSIKEAFLMFQSHTPDLIVLDLGLPDGDGIDFLKEIRTEFLTPIIVLSARHDEKDKVDALDVGANDYVTKPFGSSELLARIRNILRNNRHNISIGGFSGGGFESGPLKIDYDSRRVFMDGKEIKLTQTEYNILSLLSEHSGKVLTYSAIIKEIWGYSDFGSTKKLQVNMANIRKKLSLSPGENSILVNELGVGYRMI